MKKLFYNLVVLSAVLLVCACQTTKAKTIDWQGSEFGESLPDWAKKAAYRDYSGVAALPEMKGKTVYLFSGEGQDRDLLKAWVDTNDAAGGVVKGIKETITSSAGTDASGNKENSAAAKKMVEATTGVWSQATIYGLQKMRDFWVQVKRPDGKNEYRYYSIYGIDTKSLEEQIAEIMGKVKAETKQEQDALDRIHKQINESALAGKTIEETM